MHICVSIYVCAVGSVCRPLQLLANVSCICQVLSYSLFGAVMVMLMLVCVYLHVCDSMCVYLYVCVSACV